MHWARIERPDHGKENFARGLANDSKEQHAGAEIPLVPSSAALH